MLTKSVSEETDMSEDVVNELSKQQILVQYLEVRFLVVLVDNTLRYIHRNIVCEFPSKC